MSSTYTCQKYGKPKGQQSNVAILQLHIAKSTFVNSYFVTWSLKKRIKTK